MTDVVARIRREVALAQQLVRYANLLRKEGLEPEAAMAQAEAEVYPLPSEMWVALARAAFLTRQAKPAKASAMSGPEIPS
jgi:sulfur carrier protein ThiS